MDRIVRVVSPYLGENMARSAARAHCQKLGIEGPEVSADQIETLISRLGAGLNVFIGRERAAVAIEELKRALDSRGSAPPTNP
jgi:cell division GTPase FtsZ